MPTNSSPSGVAVRAAPVLATVPPLLTAMTGLLLSTHNADKVAQLTGCVATLVITGLPLLLHTTRADCRRAAGPDTGVTHVFDPRPRIDPSPATVAVTVSLGVAALWLLYLLTTWLGLGSLGYWSGRYPSDPSEVYRAVALRSLLVLLPGVFAVAVAMAHRLHGVAGPALFATCIGYTGAVLATNAVLVRHWGSEPLPENVYVPVVLGTLAWVVCLVARRRAARTQELFEFIQAVRMEWRRAEGYRRP